MGESELQIALSEIGILSRAPAVSDGVDLVLEPGGLQVQVKRRSLVTDDVARRFLAEAHPTDTTLIVVGDRVTSSARELLTRAGGGYLDLRGHLALRSGMFVIDTDIPTTRPRIRQKRALSGKGGLEIATSLLMRPKEPVSVRGLARQLGRSPSTVSEELRALQAADLIDSERRVTDDRLFWEVAEQWPERPVYLRESPPRSPSDPFAKALRVAIEDLESEGWALTENRAALSFGAPVALKDDDRLDFYVPDNQTLTRATTLLGEARHKSEAACTVRVAPVPAVCRERVGAEPSSRGWPLSHPVFVALGLAQDQGRGREILRDWNPGLRWTRVW